MESSQIKGLFIIVIAALLAIYLGIAAATAQTEAVAWVVGLAGVVFVLALGKNVWILLPATLGLQGTINFLPGSPPPWTLFTGVVVGMFIIRFALHRQDFIWRFSWLDAAVLLQLAAVGQAFVRNPTGLMVMGGDTAGGKPYFLFGIAVIAYFCLALARPNERMIRWAIISGIALFILDGAILTISDWMPAFASLVIPIYSNVNLATAYGQEMVTDLSTVRGGVGFSQLGRGLALPVLCMARPLMTLNPLKPHLFVPLMVGSGLVLLSGYRSVIAYLAVTYIVVALLRRKVVDVVVVGFAGFLALAIILATGTVQNLPFGAQRVLSVLPVEVDSTAARDADQSTEWRVEMWKLALGTDDFIRNKWLGDGFALSSREMKAILERAAGYENYMNSSQEQALAKGSYHGFHVETIRFTGVLGLVLALVLMIVAFRCACRLIRLFRGDPLFPYVIFVAIPFLIYPFWAMLIFGAYRAEFPQFIAMAGLLKMIENFAIAKNAARVPLPDTSSEQAAPRAVRNLPFPEGRGIRARG